MAFARVGPAVARVAPAAGRVLPACGSTPVVASARGRRLPVDAAPAPEPAAFLAEHQPGPQAPERGAPCRGGPGFPSTVRPAGPAGGGP